MRVHLIKIQSITDYVLGHQNSKIPFDNWLYIQRYASWNQPSDIPNSFPSADLLGNGSNRVIFDIGGNSFRMICKYHFGKKKSIYSSAGLAPMPTTPSFVRKIYNTLFPTINPFSPAMDAYRYTIIKTDDQYRQYCTRLESLLFEAPAGIDYTDDVELLTLLIGKWDAEHSPLPEQDPISLLKTLLTTHHLKAKDLSELLGVSKGLVSDILHYKRGLSKEVIRKLAAHFSVSQEAFNRPYPLIMEANSHLRDAKVMNTRKELESA